MKTRIGIECTLTKMNKLQMGKMVDLCEEFNLDFLGLDPVQIHSQNKTQEKELKRITLDSFEWFRVGEEIASLISLNQNKLEIKMPTLGAPKFRKYLNDRYKIHLPVGRSCPATSDTFYIRADGIAHPCNYCCDFNENTFPQNVKKEELDLKVLSFEQVADSEYFKTFYYFAHNGETYGGIGYCKECEFHEICEPCPLDILEFGGKVASPCRKFEELLKEKMDISREDSPDVK